LSKLFSSVLLSPDSGGDGSTFGTTARTFGYCRKAFAAAEFS
jgi:hypothetical protein